jgi:hypothetical protein
VSGCKYQINPLNADLNPICHLLALLGAHHILHVSRIRVKEQRVVCYVAVVQDKVGANQGLNVLSLLEKYMQCVLTL